MAKYKASKIQWLPFLALQTADAKHHPELRADWHDNVTSHVLIQGGIGSDLLDTQLILVMVNIGRYLERLPLAFGPFEEVGVQYMVQNKYKLSWFDSLGKVGEAGRN